MAKRYRVTSTSEERMELEALTKKGPLQSQKAINALILLNCDEGETNEQRLRSEDVAGVLRVSSKKIERAKKQFVEKGLDAALGGRQGRRAFERKPDGEFEARLIALSCSEPPEGFAN